MPREAKPNRRVNCEKCGLPSDLCICREKELENMRLMSRTEHIVETMPSMGLIAKRTPHYRDMFSVLPSMTKIVFTNNEALEVMKGYKVHVVFYPTLQEVRVTFTGFSKKGAEIFFNKFKAMNKEEVYGDNE